MEKSTVEKSLDASIKDGVSFAVMAGLSDMMYVGAAALLLGASRSAIALLVSVPLFLGACAQLLAPHIIERTGRRRGLFVVGSTIQAVSIVPMILAMFLPNPWGYWTLMGAVILNFMAVHVGIPAWTSVMGDLVPPGSRGRYFGRRSALALFVQFLAMVLGGVVLANFNKAARELNRPELIHYGFATIFAAALVARIFSVYFLSRMADPPHEPKVEDQFSLWQFLRRLPKSNFAKFVIFVACLNATAHFAGSLFIPYWRDALKYNDWQYMIVISSVIVIQIPALPIWGRVADRYGNKKVLVVCSVGIAVLPALWLLSTHIAWAVALQVWSGLFWSGFNQSVANFLLDAVTPGKRARCTTYLNLILNTGILLGGVAGAFATSVMPLEIGPITLPYRFWGILALSFLLRMATVVVFLPRFREVREVPEVGVTNMLFHATREAAESAVNLLAGVVPARRPRRDETNGKPDVGTEKIPTPKPQ